MKFSGVVKENLGRGRELGFPTANIPAPKDLEDGIYVGLANARPALIFVGAPKTFNETDRKSEIFILNFEGDLYNQTLNVEIIKKLRENKKFETKEALVAQMKEDEKVARQFFEDYNAIN